MLFNSNFDKAGEHPFLIEGPVGPIEGVITIPEKPDFSYFALLGHPHSLQGGTMNNKVVTTLARTFKELAIPSLRFNFRGVGGSGGKYDAGIGESEDMLFLLRLWQKEYPKAQFLFAGFSFGSYVTYRAAAQYPSAKLLISIAPPVHHYDYREFKAPDPWIIVQGDEDEVVPASLVADFAAQSTPALPLISFADTTHFFHGKLIELKDKLIENIQSRM